MIIFSQVRGVKKGAKVEKMNQPRRIDQNSAIECRICVQTSDVVTIRTFDDHYGSRRVSSKHLFVHIYQ